MAARRAVAFLFVQAIDQPRNIHPTLWLYENVLGRGSSSVREYNSSAFVTSAIIDYTLDAVSDGIIYRTARRLLSFLSLANSSTKVAAMLRPAIRFESQASLDAIDR